MTNHGVDLYRSDTGHYLQWPVREYAPAPVLPAQQARTWIDPAPVPVAPRARAWVIRPATDRGTRAVVLLNWMILLTMFCALLLAHTLHGSDAASIGTTVGATVGATVGTTVGAAVGTTGTR